jgi:hypothetical protein
VSPTATEVEAPTQADDEPHGNEATGVPALLSTPEGSLVQEEGIRDPRPPEACQRWPELLWLVNATTGEAVLGCCKCTNLCDCARRRYIRETTRVLMNDAAVSPPTIFAVLTAREFLVKGDDLAATFKQLLKSVRRRWPAAEWFVRWEDQKRGALHANLLVKGVPADDWAEFGQVLIARWCARVDAEPERSFVEDIRGNAVGYVANKIRHAGKDDQEPALARHKHRTSQTRGYFTRPMAELRAEARKQLQVEALVWRGRSLEVAEHEVALRAEHAWELRHLPGRGATGMPVTPPPENGGRSSPASSPSAGWASSPAADTVVESAGDEETETHSSPGPPVGDGPGDVDLLVTAILGRSHDGAAGWWPIPLDESDAEPSARVG